jgi:transposase
LPPYSPDFNPIEQCWFVLKNTAKKLRSQGVTLNDAIDHAFNSV